MDGTLNHMILLIVSDIILHICLHIFYNYVCVFITCIYICVLDFSHGERKTHLYQSLPGTFFRHRYFEILVPQERVTGWDVCQSSRESTDARKMREREGPKIVAFVEILTHGIHVCYIW